jgi:hypothetical protein
MRVRERVCGFRIHVYRCARHPRVSISGHSREDAIGNYVEQIDNRVIAVD